MYRCVGVIGGVFTCASYFLRVTVRAVKAVSGSNNTSGIVAAEATGVRKRWTGGTLRARPVPNRTSWIAEGAPSPSPSYASYATTASPGFPSQNAYPYSPYLSTLSGLPQTGSVPPTPNTGVSIGMPGSSSFGPPPARGHVRSSSVGGSVSMGSRSVSAGLSSFPVTPHSHAAGLPPPPIPGAQTGPPAPPSGGKKDD